MNVKHYNNVIDWTLKHDKAAQTDDSLATARAVFKNMGVALPNGSMQEVYETIKTNKYMGWRACTADKAQQAADKGTAAIGINKDKVVILSAIDEEEPVTATASVMTLSENTAAYSSTGLEYYTYGNALDTISYITVGGWLKMYMKPTCSGTCRTVNIPTVDPYTGPDGYRYEFSDRNYWYAYENPYTTKGYINPYIRKKLESMGKSVVVNIGDQGEYTNEDGRYWMAVGPKVIIPDFGDNDYNWAEKFAGKGIFDIVVKDVNGNTFYIPGAIGDTKNHTYNNGIIQTYIAYNDGNVQKGSFSSAYGNFNGTVAAEFIGNLSTEKLAPLYNYYIDSIRFYPT